MKKLIDRLIYLMFITVVYTPTNYKWYRKWKGGIWYAYYPRMFPYMSFYTQDKESLHSHEIITDIEDYNTYNWELLDDAIVNYVCESPTDEYKKIKLDESWLEEPDVIKPIKLDKDGNKI